ncbi:MAG: HlyD family efflux transporter periplasmic adaptor subunit [Candidatus Gracilibacteria bacterium]
MTFSDDVKQKKQRMSLSKWIYTIITVIVIGVIYYYFSGANKDESISISDTHIVENGDLELYVSGEGKIISGKKIELNFPITGAIKGIYKNEGEKVVDGEKIAKLNDSVYILNLERANINLKNAYARLAEIKETVSAAELKVLEKSLDLARESYENIKLKLSMTLEDENNNYDSLVINRSNLVNDIKIEKSNLELIIIDEDKKIENLGKTLSFKGNILILDIDKYLNKIDELVGITELNENQNDDFEDYLGAKDSTLKTELINDFKIFNNNLIRNRDLLNSDNDLLVSYSSSLKKILNKTFLVISNSIESTSFTITDIQNHKSDFQSYLSILELSHQALLLAFDNLDYEITNKDILIKKKTNTIEGLIGDLKLVNNDVENYSEKLDNIEKINEGELLVAQKELEKANLEYKSSIEGPTSIELKSYYIDIEDAESRVKEAENNLTDTLLNSPIDGTILDINYREGEYYGTKQESFGVIISADRKYIESYIEERDIANIFEGQKTIISVDAFESYSFTGIINYVSILGEEDTDEVTRYKILIGFDDDNSQIRDGMSVSLDLLFKKLENIIVIPSEYIVYIDGISHVILSDGTHRIIDEGSSDGETIEILSGLKVGEKIILE